MEQVDGCTYTKISEIPQTVAVRNSVAGGVSYALIVLSNAGFSTTETFGVNITLGIGGDGAESNDNAYTAYNVGIMDVNGINVNGTTLDSPKDVDWLTFSAPNLADFSGIKIFNQQNSKVKYQLYYAVGSSMVEAVPINGVYPLSTGMNYLRIVDNGNDFTSGNVAYRTGMSVVLDASQAAYTISLDDMLGSNPHYDTFPTQTYLFSGGVAEKRYALTDGCLLTWTATYISSSGYLCKDSADTLYASIYDSEWKTSVGSSSGSATASNGVARLTIKCPPAIGQVQKPVGDFGYSFYDYNVTLTMYSSGFGSFFAGEDSVPIYITSKIW